MSLITYFAYAAEKAAASRGTSRTRESTLQALALVGGWPGALVAQQRLRHKNRKSAFQLTFWAMVTLNAGTLILLFTGQLGHL